MINAGSYSPNARRRLAHGKCRFSKSSRPYVNHSTGCTGLATARPVPAPKRPQPIAHSALELSAEIDTVALILAGGRGTRLGPLTQSRCKPAVPFGTGTRIIDYTLSNCINSGIRRIGVITQYQQNSLIRYLGSSYDFLNSSRREFIDMLPADPVAGADFYNGTADAVYKNRLLLEQQLPQFTLVLAGDHIYKADYRRMVKQHIATNADVTIACCTVPVNEAHNFGIVSADSNYQIVDFEEKPANAKPMTRQGNMAYASMGFYLFNTKRLLECLSNDQSNPGSTHDFGKDIIPSMLGKRRVFAYDFQAAQLENYWRDVGTLDSYYDANMQALQPEPSIDAWDQNWPIHCQAQTAEPARFIKDSQGYSGLASDCIVAPACIVRGAQLRHSILYSDVHIDEQSVIEDSLLLPGVRIGKRCRIRNAIIDANTHIPDDTDIGFGGLSESLKYTVTEAGVVVVAADSRFTPPMVGLPADAATLQGSTRSPLSSTRQF